MDREKMNNSVVNEFVDSYIREYDYYQEAAGLCHQRCEALLGPRGIKSMVTHRAKNPRKLSNKLDERNKKTPYQTLREIRDDIADLAGVRIALYFPGDRGKVGELIAENFKIELKKEFPDKNKERPGKRFSGYHADHYRVFMLPHSLADAQKRYSDARIEIQVGSVLMHAWAEVEHDLIYKPESGNLSEDEQAILDELNGLVLSGEIALERLERALERRLSRHGVTFDNHYELAAFLYKAASGLAGGKEPPMGRVDILWEILKKAKMNKSDQLEPVLSAIDKGMEDRPIADQIADEILVEHPELYQDYISLQARLSGPNYYEHNLSQSDALSAPIGEFLSKWIILERTFTILARGSDVGRHSVFNDISKIADAISLPKQKQESLWRLKIIRNHLVHGIEIPSGYYLRQASKELDQVLNSLKNHDEQRVKEAYEKARRPIDGDYSISTL